MSEHIGHHFCGQSQPHAAHNWQTPQVYGSATLTQHYQCAGLAILAPPAPSAPTTEDGQA